MGTELESLISLRSLSREEVMQRFHMTAEHVQEGASYLKLGGLMEFHNPDMHPAWFFFKGPSLVMVDINDDEFLASLSSEKLQRELGGEGEVLRSRQGKTCNLHVHPEKGIAFSAQGDIVGLVEVFPPTNLAHYRRDIYEEPIFRK